MFDDPQKNLGQLQKELLDKEDANKWLDDELAETRRLLDGDETAFAVSEPETVRNFANGYGVDDYEDEIEETPENELSHKRTIRNLVVVALIELAGILGVLGYWFIRLL